MNMSQHVSMEIEVSIGPESHVILLLDSFFISITRQTIQHRHVKLVVFLNNMFRS